MNIRTICERCGAENRSVEVHHIKPRAKGGGSEESNLQTLCNPCHKYMNVRQTLQSRIAEYNSKIERGEKGGWASQEKAMEYYQFKVGEYKNRIALLDSLNSPSNMLKYGRYRSYYLYEHKTYFRSG